MSSTKRLPPIGREDGTKVYEYSDGPTHTPTSIAVTPTRESAGPSIFSGSAIIHGGTFLASHGNATVNNTTINYNISPLPQDHAHNLDGILAMLRGYLRSRFRDIHHDVLSRRAPRTGDSFKTSQKVRDWIKKLDSILWASGGPGGGKTFLAAAMNELLEDIAEERPDIAVAFAYLRYTEQLTAWDIIMAFIVQLVECRPLPPVLDIVAKAFARHRRKNTRPSLAELVNMLNDLVKEYAQTFISIDGLDEMPPRVQAELINILSSIQATVLITSRPLQLLESKINELTARKPVFINVVAQPEDLDFFISYTIDQTPGFGQLLDSHKIREEVVGKIKKNASGMFLHAALQIEALQHCLCLKDIREQLDQFPPGIQGLYANTMKRIENQPTAHVAIAKRILLWLSHAKSTLSIKDLQHAIAVSPDSFEFVPDRVISEGHLLSLCCGLVSADKETQQVRLIHYTAQESLCQLLQESYPQPHAMIARTCINRLVECNVQRCISDTVDEWRSVISNKPLLNYAHANSPYHIQMGAETQPELLALAEDFIRQCDAFPDLRHRGLRGMALDKFNQLHVAALFGMPALVQNLVLQGGFDVNVQAFKGGWTSLMVACREGHNAVFEQLLDLGARADAPDNDGETPLLIAAKFRRNDMVRRLLQVPGTEIDQIGVDGKSALIFAVGADNEPLVCQLLAATGLDVNKVEPKGWSPLMYASAMGFERITSHLLKAPGIDVNYIGEGGRWTSLLLASWRGQIQVVKQLLSFPGIEANITNDQGHTALTMAATTGRKAIVEYLLAVRAIHGIDVDHTIDLGWSALMLASTYVYTGVVECLLATPGININRVDDDGTSALIQASKHGSGAVVKQLLSAPGIEINRPDLRRKWTPLVWAVVGRHKEVVNLLLAAPGIDVNHLDAQGKSALSWACLSEELDEMQQYLLAAPGIEVNRFDNDGMSPLIRASGSGPLCVIQNLVAFPGTDINQTEPGEGWSALMVAASSGNEDVVECLLSSSSIDVNKMDGRGSCALSLSASRGRVGVVRRLLAVPGIDVNQVGEDGLSALMLASSAGHADAVRLLVAFPGTNVSQTDREGRSALMHASRWGKEDIVDCLLEAAGNDVNGVDKLGLSLLATASGQGHEGVVERLLAVPGIDVNHHDTEGYSALMKAAMGGYVGVVQHLLAFPDININQVTSPEFGWSALMVASARGYTEIVERFLAATGIDVNRANTDGMTALMLAASKGHVEVVECFVRTPGVDVNKVSDGIGISGLILAAFGGHHEVVKSLLTSPTIDVNQVNTNGYSALLYAAMNGHVEVVKCLLATPGVDAQQNGITEMMLAAMFDGDKEVEVFA